MANYYLEFSFMVYDLTKKEREWFENLDEENYYGIFDGNIEVNWEPGEYAIDFAYELEKNGCWIYSDGGYGNPDNVAALLQKFLQTFRPNGAIGFSWASYCSKPRVDEQGGGACKVTAENTEWIHTGMWLDKVM